MKKLWMLALTACLFVAIVLALPVNARAAEIVESGTCGDNLTWTLDDDGLLTISGTGDMPWCPPDFYPWSFSVIKKIVIQKGITSISDYAFGERYYLTSVTIPNSVTTIGAKAFSNCSDLRSITIPASVTSIGDGAFSGCTSLSSVSISENVPWFRNTLFSDCSKLKYNTYDNAKYLGNADNPYIVLVKSTSDSITSCKVNAKTKIIAPGAFSHCEQLKTVAIPKGITGIGADAFSCCTNLTSVTIPGSVVDIPAYAFSACSSLKSVTISKGVTCIGEAAFYGCSSLTSITIPDSVISIDNYSFYQCNSLTSVTIPASVRRIGELAFYECYDMKTVTFIGDAPVISSTAFLGNTIKVRYPFGNKTWTSSIRNSCQGTITWITYNPLKITAQPKNAYAVIGDTVKTSVKASGDGLTYEWYIKNAGASKYSKSSNTTAAYSCKMNSTTNGRYAKCKITDQYGSSTWTKVVLLKSKAFAITKQPVSKTVKTGTTANFSVTPNSTNVSYQWQYRTSSSGSWKKSSETGSNKATLSVPATFSRYGYQYRCKITHSAGSVIYTNAVTLRVTGIKTQPVNKAVVVGKTATFTVFAAGPSLKYQWQYRSSSSGKWSSARADGNKTNTLSITATNGRHNYQYRCKITDSAGNTVYTKTVSLYVLGIKTQPASKTVKVGATAKFTVAATGTGLKFQWQYRTSSNGSWRNTSATGSKTKTLSVPGTTSRNGYQYRCKITDSAGNVIYTNAVKLTVKK